MGSMHIVCPHCTTSYAIDLATLGAAGRTVRCSRCKEVWLARPEDAFEIQAPEPAMAAASGASAQNDAEAEWEALAREDDRRDTPVVDSPSISADMPAGDADIDWAVARDGLQHLEGRQRRSWFHRLFRA